MRQLSFLTADVFTDQPFGGNPLAVFPEATGLPDALMQRIAAELNLSETVFVQPPRMAQGTRRLRIFTPAIELPFAGHPTVGAAIVLAETGAFGHFGQETEIVFEEEAGPVGVRLERDGAALTATLTAPRTPEPLGGTPSPERLARLLGLPVGALADGIAPGAYSAGVPFTIVPVRDAAALAAARVDIGLWQSDLAGTPAPHLYVVAVNDWSQGRTVRARMFAPAMGITEDPATGGACAALAGFLADRQKIGSGTAAWLVTQGIEMGRPSAIRLAADIERGRVTAARVGGGAVMMSQGRLTVPT